MKNELKIFITAVMFYTRIPIPKKIGFSGINLNNSIRYLPLIGILVGSFSALIYYLSNFLFASNISLIFSMISSLMITGAFHEDGFADYCDGMGGGFKQEKILQIMKDSRLGSFGTIGLILILFLKYALLLELSFLNLFLLLIIGHSLSRFTCLILVYTSSYVQNEENSKSKEALKNKSPKNIFIALFFSIIPLCFLPYIQVFIILLNLTIVFFLFKHYTLKKINGYTGDVLGALQQISEICIYTSLVIFI